MTTEKETPTEAEMEQAIEEARTWLDLWKCHEGYALVPGMVKGLLFVSQLLEIVEYQKGVGLAAWAENKVLKERLKELGK